MDANATPDKATGKSESSSADIPSIESPALVPEQGEGAAPAETPAKPPVTALVIAQPRIEADSSSGPSAADRAKAKVAAVLAILRTQHAAGLAATILIAAIVGAAAGSLGTLAASKAFAPPPAVDPHVAEARALKDSVAHLQAQLAGVRAGAEATAKAATQQVAKLNERVERAEKAERARLAAVQTAAQLALATPATVPARPSPVAAATAANTPDNTASITGSISGSRQTPPPAMREASRAPVIPGWVLRNVQAGTAYIESREGMIEVAVGDRLPDGGRVEAIRRENGRWIVLTTHGMVTMR